MSHHGSTPSHPVTASDFQALKLLMQEESGRNGQIPMGNSLLIYLIPLRLGPARPSGPTGPSAAAHYAADHVASAALALPVLGMT